MWERGERADEIQGVDDDTRPKVIWARIGLAPATEVGGETEEPSTGEMVSCSDGVGAGPVLLRRNIAMAEDNNGKRTVAAGKVESTTDAEPVAWVANMGKGVGLGFSDDAHDLKRAARIGPGT